MKKLLATLIVATMLLSCVSVIALAAWSSNVYTATDFLGALEGTVYDSENDLSNPFALDYYENLKSATGINNSTRNNDPIYAALDEVADGGDLELPEKMVAGNYVAFPVYADGNGVCSGTMYFTYDTNVFEFAGCSIKGYTDESSNPVTFANATEIKGCIGSVFFKCKATPDNDTITMSTGDAYFYGPTTAEKATVGNKVMTVNPSAASKEDAEYTDLGTVVKYTQKESADLATDFEGITVVEGEGKGKTDLSLGYTIGYCNFDLTEFNTPEEVGVALWKGGEFRGFFPSQTIEDDATVFKFGILFYGSHLQDFEMVPYVKYSGSTAVYNNIH